MAAGSSSSSPSATGGDTVPISPVRSPSPVPLPAPPPPPPSSSSSRRLPPPCWTNEETLALIDSYREKWYSLRRGNLRASHWEEVAEAVARRCHRLPGATPKTSVQCRHKVEKLRKRYRADKQRSLSHDPSSPPSSSWIFFRKMDAMERGGSAAADGPGGGAISRPSLLPAAASPDSDDDDGDDDGGGVGNVGSIHRLMANGGGGGIGGLRFRIPKAVRSKIVGSRAEERSSRGPSLNGNPSNRLFRGFGGVKPGVEEMRRRLEKRRRIEKRRGEGEGDAVGEMVNALRMLGDGYVRMEEMKMEMAREMEKVRMEMELKRTEMILDSQRRIVDSFINGFVEKKRTKVSPRS